MSCDVAVAAHYLAFASPSMEPVGFGANMISMAVRSEARSLSREPLYAAIVTRATDLRRRVDRLVEQDDVAAIPGLKPDLDALSGLDMKAHFDLAARGTDGDLKCILKGISVDLVARYSLLSKAADQRTRQAALVEMSYLLRDNIEVITAPPAPPV